jgi:hypothetical protein
MPIRSRRTRSFCTKLLPALSTCTSNFHGWNAADFGCGGDTTANILWRLERGELDGVNPRVIVLLAGTNDLGAGLDH